MNCPICNNTIFTKRGLIKGSQYRTYQRYLCIKCGRHIKGELIPNITK